MSQEQRQPLYCPECKGKEPLLKIAGAVVGCCIEVICKNCEPKQRYRFILTQDGWERSKIYDN